MWRKNIFSNLFVGLWVCVCMCVCTYVCVCVFCDGSLFAAVDGETTVVHVHIRFNIGTWLSVIAFVVSTASASR